MRGRIVLLIFLWVVNGVAGDSVTFRVDMNECLLNGLFDPRSGDHVAVRGSFDNWQGDVLVLDDKDLDGVYAGSFTVVGEIDSLFEYKFIIAKSSGAVCWEFNPEPDNPPYGNRVLRLTGRSRHLPLGPFVPDRYDLHYTGVPVAFSREQVRTDVIQLREVLETIHCCLYEYTPKAIFDSLFQNGLETVDGTMQPHDIFRLLAPVVERVGCGHTSLWMPMSFWTLDTTGLFPLQVRLVEDAVLVSGPYEDRNPSIPRGSRIHEIGSRSVRDIVEELRAGYAADAFNDGFRYSQIERRFPMLYARYYGFAESFQVTYTLPNQDHWLTTVLPGTHIDSVRARVFRAPVLRFTIDTDHDAALLIVNSFGYYDRVPFFRSFLDSTFTTIKNENIKHLILDLRGNDGGDPFCAAPLFSYLESEPLPYFAEPYGKYSELAEPVAVAENRFTGSLYVLIDSRCFSTNGHFCSLLKYHGIGTLIGTETGASFVCNAATETWNLTHSRLMLFVPRQSFAAAVEGMDKRHGIRPDHAVAPTIDDFLKNRDTVLEYAFDLIHNSLKQSVQ